MTITIAGFFALVGIALAIYFMGGEQDSSVPIKLRAMLSVSSLALFLGLSAAVAFGYPQYKVWEQSKAGEAALAKATQDRQIKVQEAEAEQEAASKQAEANRILGESIRQYPESMDSMTKRKVWIGLIIYAVVCMTAFVTMLILIFR